MSSISPCSDVSDMKEFNKSFGLYLKPICKASVTLLLPASLAKQSISISNWDIQEKLRQVSRPLLLESIKVVKTTLDTLKFEIEVNNRKEIKQLMKQMSTIDTIKIQGWPEPARVHCSEAKIQFPSRHDWESFFRDANGLDEMKPGQRPDTLFIKGLPIRWFRDAESSLENPLPSLNRVHQVFKALGEVRIVDIPMLDEEIRQGRDIETAFGKMCVTELVFDAYVQYREYAGFVKAMDTLRAQKLIYKPNEGNSQNLMYSANITVDFDRSQHLSEAKIQRRAQDLQRAKEQVLKKKREHLKRKMQEEKEALTAKRRELTRKRVEDEAHRLCQNLILLISKDEEEEKKKKKKKKVAKKRSSKCSASRTEEPQDIEEDQRRKVLLAQEQRLRQRLLTRLHAKKL